MSLDDDNYCMSSGVWRAGCGGVKMVVWLLSGGRCLVDQEFRFMEIWLIWAGVREYPALLLFCFRWQLILFNLDICNVHNIKT